MNWSRHEESAFHRSTAATRFQPPNAAWELGEFIVEETRSWRSLSLILKVPFQPAILWFCDWFYERSIHRAGSLGLTSWRMLSKCTKQKCRLEEEIHRKMPLWTLLSLNPIVQILLWYVCLWKRLWKSLLCEYWYIFFCKMVLYRRIKQAPKQEQPRLSWTSKCTIVHCLQRK